MPESKSKANKTEAVAQDSNVPAITNQMIYNQYTVLVQHLQQLINMMTEEQRTVATLIEQQNRPDKSANSELSPITQRDVPPWQRRTQNSTLPASRKVQEAERKSPLGTVLVVAVILVILAIIILLFLQSQGWVWIWNL